MLSTGNKAQIINIISKYLIEKLQIPSFRGKFVITFPEDIPVQAENNVSKRTDLKSLYAEGDKIIKQCITCVKHEINHLKVICDNTDIFVMLTVYVTCCRKKDHPISPCQLRFDVSNFVQLRFRNLIQKCFTKTR